MSFSRIPASQKYDKKKIVLRFLSLSPEHRSKEFISLKETAKLVNKSVRTIRDWILFDKVVAIRLGERKDQYIYYPSLVEYLQNLQDKEFAAEDDI